MIGFKHHLAKYGNMYAADWESTSRSEVQQILASITSFEYIVVFLTVYQFLSHMSGFTVKPQKSALNIAEAHEMVVEISKLYQRERENIDATFGLIYTQSVRMAEKIGTPTTMPRIPSRQQHRNNAEACYPWEYFKKKRSNSLS